MFSELAIMSGFNPFPVHISESVENIVLPDDYEIAFQIRVEQNRMIFEDLPSTGYSRENLKKDFTNIRREATMPCQHLEDISWDKVDKRLDRPAAECNPNKKNAGVTTAFRVRNLFLVKRFFTFGIQRTSSELCHVYQTHAKPLLFYFPIMPNYDPIETFKSAEQAQYNCFVMDSNSFYLVPENTTYLILTTDKSYFSVHVVNDASNLPPNLLINLKCPFANTFCGYKYREQRTAVGFRDFHQTLCMVQGHPGTCVARRVQQLLSRNQSSTPIE